MEKKRNNKYRQKYKVSARKIDYSGNGDGATR